VGLRNEPDEGAAFLFASVVALAFGLVALGAGVAEGLAGAGFFSFGLGTAAASSSSGCENRARWSAFLT